MAEDQRHVAIMRDRAAYRQRVRELVRSGDTDAPVPVLAGPALDRSLALMPATAHQFRRFPGVVLTVAGDKFAPLGAALAHYTQRPVAEVGDCGAAWEIASSERRPVTVVLEPRTVTPEVLSAVPATQPVAIFTARDFAAGSALLLRTLVHRPGPSLDVLTVDARDRAGTVTAAREATTATPDIITFSTHGRECGLILRRGVLCGRARAEVQAAPGHAPPGPLTACEQGHGCYVNGWRGDRLVAADSLNAAVILVDSCRGLRVAGGAFGSRVSLALAALDGRAIGFVGSTWLRSGQDGAREIVLASLRRGDVLADAVAAANEALGPMPESLGPYTVIGDAGVQLARGPADGDAAAAGRAGRDACCLSTSQASPATSAASRRTRQRAPSDLLASCSLFPASAGLRSAAARLTSDDSAAAGAVHIRLVSDLAESYQAEVYNFCGDWPRPLARTGWRPARCHTCRSAAARIDTFRSPAIPAVQLATERCPKCTGVQEGFADAGFSWRWSGGTVTATRGARFSAALRLCNTTGGYLRGSIGAAVPDGAYYSAHMDPARLLTVPPRADTALSVGGVFDEDGPVSDFHYVKILICLNGRVSVLTRPVYLFTPQSAADAGSHPWAAGERADPELVAAARSVMQATLGVDQITSGETGLDFFTSGGDSLLAVALLERVREQFAVVLRLRDFLLEPTAAGLALLIAEGREARRQL